MTRAVLDTNVLISAYGFGGRPADLLRAGISGEFEIVVSPALLHEFVRVAEAKLGVGPEVAGAMGRQVARIADLVKPGLRLEVVSHAEDNRVLECAIAGDASAIVSGDRHLLDLGEYEGVRIPRVAEFLEELGLGEG